MAEEKWNEIKKIIRNGQLEFDEISNDMLCIICEKVLINTYNGPCGCRYCLECITKFLKGEEKFCPGNTDYCKDEFLSNNRNILLDQPMNQKILETIVKCPHRNCEFKDKLRTIKQHMSICESQPIECPFLKIGCQECNLANTNMKSPMFEEIVSHSKLLLELIDNLKNEIKLINGNSLKLEKENKSLKKCIKVSKLKYENDNRGNKEHIKEIENKLTFEQNHVVQLEEDIRRSREEQELLKQYLSENKKCIENLKLQYESENKDIKEKFTELKNTFVKEQKVVFELKRVLEILTEERESLSKDAVENKACVNNSNLKHQSLDRSFMEILKEIKNKLLVKQKKEFERKSEVKEKDNEGESMNQDLSKDEKETETKIDDKKMVNPIPEQKNFQGGLDWYINEWKQKSEEAIAINDLHIDSDPFYSHKNGYKMILSVWPYGKWGGERTHLSIWCGVMRGEYDDYLQWLFKHDITFELINQHTGEIHTSCTLRHDDNYENPGERFYWKDVRKQIESNDLKCICYNYKLISLKNLSNNHSLIVNDQILIRCRVKIIK